MKFIIHEKASYRYIMTFIVVRSSFIESLRPTTYDLRPTAFKVL